MLGWTGPTIFDFRLPIYESPPQIGCLPLNRKSKIGHPQSGNALNCYRFEIEIFIQTALLSEPVEANVA